MNGDHAQRIVSKRAAESDDAAIADMEQRAAPLLWTVYIVAVTVVLCLAGDLLVKHIDSYLDMAAQQEALVQCLNGKIIGLGNEAAMRCQVYPLMQTASAEVQP